MHAAPTCSQLDRSIAHFRGKAFPLIVIMADEETKSRDDVVSPVNDSDLESQDDKEEVFLLESDSEDDSDSERKPVDSVQVEKIERKMPGINPRIDQSLSDIVVGIVFDITCPHIELSVSVHIKV